VATERLTGIDVRIRQTALPDDSAARLAVDGSQGPLKT
jgi:hypothetical protein